MPEAAIAPPPAAAPAAPADTGSRSTPNLDTAFAGFDALVAEPETTPDPTPEPEAKPEADVKPQPETKPPTPTPGQPPQPQKVKAATLREMLDKTTAEAGEWKSKYEKLTAEAAKPKPDTEKEQLLKDREAWTKTRAELENEIKFAKYEASQEYKDKYQKPFLTAYEQGQKLMTALNLKTPDKLDQFGEVVEPGQSRRGTEADWDHLMSITDEDTANKFIADHFGHNAARITVLRDRVLELNTQMRNAVDDYRKQGAERETQLRELTARQQKELSDRWHEANKHASEKYPQYFAPDAADQKATALWENGTRLADLAFGVLNQDEIAKLPQSIQAKMVNGKLPPAEQAFLHSAIRNRAAAYDRLIYKLNLGETELKELREKLAGYEASEPGRGQARKVQPPGEKKGVPSSFAEVDAAFDALAAGNG